MRPPSDTGRLVHPGWAFQLLASLVFTSLAAAQNPSPSPAPAGAGSEAAAQTASAPIYRVDVAVPEGPAFMLTGGSASDLVRPATVREFTAAFGSFVDEDGRPQFPASFGVEIAPRLLFFGRNLTVERYASPGPLQRAWSTLRVSGSAQRANSASAPALIALGVRLSPINGADPRLNRSYRERVRVQLDSLADLQFELLDVEECLRPAQTQPPPADAPAPVGPPPSSARPPSASCPEALARRAALAGQRDAVVDRLKALRERFERENWNATALDFAAASSWAPRDRTGASPRVMDYAAWGSYSQRLGAWAQALVGARLLSARDSATDHREAGGMVGGRIYMGRNELKAFVEGQYPFREMLGITPIASAGAEVRLWEDVWATFSLGYETEGDETPGRLVSRFSLRSGKPAPAPARGTM